MLKLLPKGLFDPDGSGCLLILKEEEWRGIIGITQSLGWEHYAVHGTLVQFLSERPSLLYSPDLVTRNRSIAYPPINVTAPEPHVLLFRRLKSPGEEKPADNGRSE